MDEQGHSDGVSPPPSAEQVSPSKREFLSSGGILEDSNPKRRRLSKDSSSSRSRLIKYSPRNDTPQLTEVHLECKELWRKFNELGTEMIITKAGRRMFPVVRIRCSGLVPSENYIVAMDVQPVDDMRYRYAYHRSTWMVAGKADPPPAKRFYIHPDCPFTGEQLVNQVISFEKVKLTNNELDQNGHVILNSMHKYQPIVKVFQKPSKWDGSTKEVEDLIEEAHGFRFPETVFIAVTAYQNQLITKLKINSNPFAKGFRDSSRFFNSESKSSKPSYGSCHCTGEAMHPCQHQQRSCGTPVNNNVSNVTDRAKIGQVTAYSSYPHSSVQTSASDYRYGPQVTNTSLSPDSNPSVHSVVTDNNPQVEVEYARYRLPVPGAAEWHLAGPPGTQFPPVYSYQPIGPAQQTNFPSSYLPPHVPALTGVWSQGQQPYYPSSHNMRQHMK